MSAETTLLAMPADPAAPGLSPTARRGLEYFAGKIRARTQSRCEALSLDLKMIVNDFLRPYGGPNSVTIEFDGERGPVTFAVEKLCNKIAAEIAEHDVSDWLNKLNDRLVDLEQCERRNG
jgi:hypothetical protein